MSFHAMILEELAPDDPVRYERYAKRQAKQQEKKARRRKMREEVTVKAEPMVRDEHIKRGRQTSRRTERENPKVARKPKLPDNTPYIRHLPALDSLTQCSGLSFHLSKTVTPEVATLRQMEEWHIGPSSTATLDSEVAGSTRHGPSSALTAAERHAATTKWVRAQRSVDIALDLERVTCQLYEVTMQNQYNTLLQTPHENYPRKFHRSGKAWTPEEIIAEVYRDWMETRQQLHNLPLLGNWPSPDEHPKSDNHLPIPQVLKEFKDEDDKFDAEARVPVGPPRPLLQRDRKCPPCDTCIDQANTVTEVAGDINNGLCWHAVVGAAWQEELSLKEPRKYTYVR